MINYRSSLSMTTRAAAVAALGGLLALSACSPKAGDAETKQNAVKPTYSPTTGVLEKLEYDSNKNGKIDSVAYMQGTKILRLEIDKDEDGTIERWEYYKPDQTLEKVGMSRSNNGKVDTWAYQGADGEVDRIEMATGTGETPNRTEYYVKGAKVRAEEDSNRDGKIDRWETWEGDALTSVSFDTNADGKPDRTITYPGGSATGAKAVVAPKGDK
jgi:hypothetical protein